MTTPGGVTNLPVGALTVDTLASKTQDMTPAAMRGRAADRVPSIFNSSTGGNMLSDLSPFGIIAQLFAGFNSHIANADPADIQGPEDLPGLLLDFIEELPVIGTMVGLLEAILGTYDGDDPVLLAIQDIFTLIRNLFGGLLDFGDPGSVDPAAVWHAVVSVFLLPLNLLLGPDSPVNALNIFNQVPAALLGQVSFSSIGNLHPNLLTAGNFPNAASIADNPIWTFDPTVSRTGDGTGSAKVTANGTDRVLRSNLIGVSAGDTIDLSAWVKWSGLIFTGSPLQLSVRQFLGNTMVSDVAIASLTPGGSSGGFTKLSGTYTAPAGVDRVYTRVVVTAAATAGTVWYDDGSSNKTGLLQIPWMQNLPEAFDGLTSLFNLGSFTDLIDGGLDPSYVWTQIINSILLPLNLLTRQGDFTNLMANLGGGTATLAAIATRLQNIAAGGTIAGGAISGTITAPVQDVIDGFKNLSNTWFGGSSATGTPAEVATTVASIKSAVLSGWNVQIFTSSNSAWLVPSGTTQMKGCVVCGGGKGQNGSATNAATAAGGLGGSDGGYLSADLDLTGITAGSSTLNITVGAAATTAGADGGQSSIKFGATTLLAGAPNANGIATDQGLVGTTSQPGSGGNGGTGRDATTSDSGTKGEDSGIATGGAGGVGAAAGSGTGNAGSAGGAGTSASIPLCGGAGGGGGAGKGTGSSIQSVTGGTGGNGGFPGGGSGGGGGAANSGGGSRTGGSAGTPGNGLVAILYK